MATDIGAKQGSFTPIWDFMRTDQLYPAPPISITATASTGNFFPFFG